MADEARAMLDALMGADRNASLASKGISAGSSGSRKRRTPGGDHQGGSSVTSGHSSSSDNIIVAAKRQKRSCFSADICPYYTAWGIDMYELFTNTKSDLGGVNEFIVDEDAHEEFKALPEIEKERLGYERMLFRKLGDLLRQVDRTVSRSKEKLRQELAQKKRENRNVDPVCLAKHEEEKLDRVASMTATLEDMEMEITKMVQQLEELEEDDNALVLRQQQQQQQPHQVIAATEPENGTTSKMCEPLTEQATENYYAVIASEENGVVTNSTTDELSKPPIIEEIVVDNVDKPSSDDLSPIPMLTQIVISLEDIQKREQRELQKIALVEAIMSCLQQIQPLRDNISQLTKSLYIFRADTSADKIVCEVSGNFMSSRDAEERIAAHYAGKQYVGWKAVRGKLQELEKKFRGRPPPRQPPLLPHERELYKRDMLDRGQQQHGGRGGYNAFNDDPRGRGGRGGRWGGGSDMHRSRYSDNRGAGYYDDYRGGGTYEGRGGGGRYGDRGGHGRDGHLRH